MVIEYEVCSTDFLEVGSNGVSRLEALDDRHIGQPATLAHGLQTETLATPVQRVDQGGHQFCAGTA